MNTNTIALEYFSIESAPDDREILLWDTEFEKWTFGCWVPNLTKDGGVWVDLLHDEDLVQPSHWAPTDFLFKKPV